MEKIYVLGLVCFIAISSYAQSITDTVQKLNEVEINAYFETQPLMQSPASINVVDSKKISEWSDHSLVPALNSVPGVRMEERSPGSYRLSIRGSLLRSPFGVRNVKMYLGDFPLTDAGGNTYINILDPGIINRIEILKGPEASIFGANSGGVILIDPIVGKSDSSFVSTGISAGSYGTFHQKVMAQQSFKNYRINISQGFQRSDGYRENSTSKRHYIQLFQQWNYIPKGQLKAIVLFSDLTYRTPGGLTLPQFESNPRAARYPTTMLPGAISQQAGIFNQTTFVGLSHDFYFTPRFKHHIALFGSHTNFENPFITNYEVRKENSGGVRTYIEHSNRSTAAIILKWQTGLEAQRTVSKIDNFDNNGGNKGSVQASDDLIATQHFYFTRLSTIISKRLTIETALSLNYYQYRYRSELQSPLPSYNEKIFNPQLMPRVALAYFPNSYFSWRASVSRGYSPPTIAEVRPSDNLVYVNLQPEKGWNYETGIRLQNKRKSLFIDAVVFYYQLESAIVRRTTDSGTEYFVNAGGTKQTGIETQLSVWIIEPRNYSVVRGLQLWDSYTHYHFLFSNYQDATTDYSENRLTGVPSNVNVCGATLTLPSGFYLFGQYNYTAQIPLNDLNSVYAKEYHLVQLKGGWKTRIKKVSLELFAGADNLLNQSYSLGNDLNAIGGRYYNPAPLRNYFGGLALTF
jgi:iron complex outermembrane receptor protein